MVESSTEAVIVSAVRTPIGRAIKGSLVDVRPDDLAAQVVRSVLDRAGVTPGQVEDLILGCAQPAGEQGYNLARVVALLAGLGDVPGVTVNRYCASSLQAIRMAVHAIWSGEGECFVAAGVDCVSRFSHGKADGLPDTQNPRFSAARSRTADAVRNGGAWAEADDLPDIYIEMGQTAENVADLKGVSRDEMDQFALLSHRRAVESQESGFFDAEIVPVQTLAGVVMKDDGPRRDTTIERLSQLKPVFREHGSVTAGNACPLNDGAAATLVTSTEFARSHQLTPLVRVISSGVSALNPEIMGLGPVEATKQALARARMSIDDIDLVEINEAFAAQVIPCARELDIEWDRLNVHGGAIALGHPFGMTGARIMTTLINSLQERDQTFGLETMCVGGGQGMAMIVERLS